MRCVSHMMSGRRRARAWTVTLVAGRMLAATLLVAFGAMGQAGALREKPLTGDGLQGAEASSQGTTSRATVRLRVEGMVCYG